MSTGPTFPSGPLELTLLPTDAGDRLDVLLTKRVGSLGRKGAAALFASGRVRVDGHVAKKGDRAVAGQHLVVELGDCLGHATAAPEVPLKLVLVRDTLAIAEKPAGIPSGALPGSTTGTLAGALLHRFPEIAEVGFGPREPGIVHRLDTMTSGLLLAARTRAAFEHLQQEMAGERIDKRYLAITQAGLTAQGHITLPLAPHPSDARRVTPTSDGTKRDTVYRTLDERRGWALVEVTAKRAYRHQVRAHLAALGHPLAGDALYGGQAIEGYDWPSGRHALHASYIAGTAADGARFVAESALPADLATFWDAPPPR